MNQLPDEIRFTYIVAIVLTLIFVLLIIVVVVLYSKKQIIFNKEKELKESEFENLQLVQELERKNAVLKERERISHDMHDDLGAGISALKLQAEFLKQKVKDESLKADIEELLKTSEEMNLSMREMLWSLNMQNDNLGNFVQYTTIYAENFLLKSGISFSFKKIGIIDETLLKSEFRRNLFLCIKEALNNIYKHSNAENAVITFKQSDEILTITIKDDGCGMKENSKKGNGLHNMDSRMKDICGNIDIISDNGCQITLEVKLQTVLF